MPSAIKRTGRPEVFVVTIAPGLRNCATRASNFLLISSKMHGSPAFAKCAAIREPIVPAPSTTAFSMRRFMARLFTGFERKDRLQNQHALVKHADARPPTL